MFFDISPEDINVSIKNETQSDSFEESESIESEESKDDKKASLISNDNMMRPNSFTSNNLMEILKSSMNSRLPAKKGVA